MFFGIQGLSVALASLAGPGGLGQAGVRGEVVGAEFAVRPARPGESILVVEVLGEVVQEAWQD